MSKILEKLQKNCRTAQAQVLSESKFFSDNEMVTTSVPMINAALSGRLDGGLTSGFTAFAGPSKHFKTSFALLVASSYLKKYPDAALLFYDSEFGSPQTYFESFGIDTARVFHTPVTNIEELKFDLVHQLNELDRSDKVIIIIDSLGNIASKKEVEDAENMKSVADMTRAKAMKSLTRMVTPMLKMKDIPMIGINHTYKTQEMFSKEVVSGGTGIIYAADNIWIIGRQQDKVGTEIQGYHFIINVEKSRFVKEKSKIPISVSWDGGIEKWSGLIEVALEGGFAYKPKNGWYNAKDPETGEDIFSSNKRAKDTLTAEFWEPIFKKTTFEQFVKNKYTIGQTKMISEDISEDEVLEENE